MVVGGYSNVRPDCQLVAARVSEVKMVWAPKAHDYLQIRNNKIEWPEGFQISRPFFFWSFGFANGWSDNSAIRNPQSAIITSSQPAGMSLSWSTAPAARAATRSKPPRL